MRYDFMALVFFNGFWPVDEISLSVIDAQLAQNLHGFAVFYGFGDGLNTNNLSDLLDSCDERPVHRVFRHSTYNATVDF